MDKGRKLNHKSNISKIPRNLPPLQDKPRVPVPLSPLVQEPSESRFIGSPPPSDLKWSKTNSTNSNFLFDEFNLRYEDSSGTERVVFTPNNTSLRDSPHPKITIQSPNPENSANMERVSPSAKTRRSISLSSLGSSTNSPNSTLTLPPKLLFNGSSAVQEFVPDSPTKMEFRRPSTPSIKDLPSPLDGFTKLDAKPVPPKSSKQSRLSPLPKR